jgi:citrate lyase subunit beta/citryl-CoA lyase
MRLRSPLFAPGDSERKMTKAIASVADAVILDLEDSVAAPAKTVARTMVPVVVRAHPGRGLIVRVNPRSTPWYLEDLAAVVPARPAAVMLPKCSGPEDLAALDHHLEALEAAAGAHVGGIGVVAIVTETGGSVFHLGGYGSVASRLIAICFGAEDLSADLGISPRRRTGLTRRPSCWRAPRRWWRPAPSAFRRSTRPIRTTMTPPDYGARRMPRPPTASPARS